MLAGGDKFAEEPAITDINVTPLVDISLVLVIIFMVTAPMVIQSGIIVNSSKVTAAHGKSTRSDSIQVKLTAKNIYVNNKKVSPEQFPSYIEAKLAKNKKKLIMLTSDRAVSHGRMVWVLDVSKMKGAKKLAIMREDKKKKKK